MRPSPTALGRPRADACSATLSLAVLVLGCASGGSVPSRGRCARDTDCAVATESCVEGRCAPPSATLAVDLRTDYAPMSEFDGLAVMVDGSPRLSLRAASLDYRVWQRLGELPAVTSGRRAIEVRLLRGSVLVAARTVVAEVLGDGVVFVVVARSCAGRMCPAEGDPASATACDERGCVPPECTPDEPALCASPDAGAPVTEDAGAEPPIDAGLTTDAGGTLDAATPDAGPPPDPCAGLACAGHGWCEAGLCLCDVGYAGASCEICDGSWRAESGSAPLVCRPSSALDGTESGDPMLDGTSGDDFIRGLGGDDMIRGLDGSDHVNGNLGRDSVNGNVGRDEVAGGADDDVVIGGMGNDVVIGDLGVDRLIGGDGDDTLQGNAGDDRYMIDGLGNDRFEDDEGLDAARCVPGIRVISDTRVGADRLLILSNGSRVTIVGDRSERVLGCS